MIIESYYYLKVYEPKTSQIGMLMVGIFAHTQKPYEAMINIAMTLFVSKLTLYSLQFNMSREIANKSYGRHQSPTSRSSIKYKSDAYSLNVFRLTTVILLTNLNTINHISDQEQNVITKKMFLISLINWG